MQLIDISKHNNVVEEATANKIGWLKGDEQRGVKHKLQSGSRTISLPLPIIIGPF